MKVFYPLVFLFFSADIRSLQQRDDEPLSNARSEKPINGVRIAWDYATLQQVSPVSANYSGYARMIKLRDGSLFCVYESDKNTHAVKSLDGGKRWSEPIVIAAAENNIARAVPEVLELSDGSILVSYNLRPPRDNSDPEKRFSIQVIRSLDGGKRWSKPVEVYRAGFEFKNGCWEPAQIQLPTGEVQLYIANEGPYTQSEEQEITMFRSFDQGATWSHGEKISFRTGHRDGMPVPLLLKSRDEIIVAIEDNGISGKEFKPAILRTSVVDCWTNAPVLGSDEAREYAMDGTASIPVAKYAGAPYIRQLSTEEVILSYQSNERRLDFQWDRSDMIVAIGTSKGRNFNRKSFPFHINDPSKTALWSSLCVENDSTVIALTSTNAFGQMAVWMIKGYVLPEIICRRTTITSAEERRAVLWNAKAPIFIGGYGSTQARINAAWNPDFLFLTADVSDEKVFSATGTPEADDAVQFLLDPQNHSLVLPDEDIFSITVTAGGKCFFEQGKNGSWSKWDPPGILTTCERTAKGYRIELAIPWPTISYKPVKNERIGFHAVVLETSSGTDHAYEEPLAGNITDASFSWSPMFLID